MNLPPGIQYLVQFGPRLAFPGLLVYVSFKYVFPPISGICLPAYVSVLFAVLTVPTRISVGHFLTHARSRRAAKAAGAVLPPRVECGFMGLGNLKKMENFLSMYPGEFMKPIIESHGNCFFVEFPRAGGGMVFTTEPEHIKAILATRFTDFVKGPEFYDQSKSLLGTGIFNADGDVWKYHRQVTRPYFSRERISHFDIFDRHATKAISLIKTRISEGHAVDMQYVASRFSLDSAGEFLCGLDVQSLSAGLPYPESSGVPNSSHFQNHPSNVFVTAVVESQLKASQRLVLGSVWPLAEFWKDKVKPHREVVDQFIDTVMESVKARKKEKRDDFDDSSLLEYLLKYTEDPEMLRDEVINLLVAGSDTTSSLITYSVYVMTQYPEVTRRLRKEVLDVIGPERRPTFDDIKGMKYLRAFLNETLRLYSVVPFNGRRSVNDTVWPSKIPGQSDLFIPGDTLCVYSVFMMHRRTDLWGPTALEFDPDRFIDERLKYFMSNPFIFLPFNAGPRICLGQQFAYNEASYFLIKLLQTFSTFEFAEDAQPASSRPPEDWKNEEGVQGKDKIWPGFHLTLYVKGGMWVRMKSMEAT